MRTEVNGGHAATGTKLWNDTTGNEEASGPPIVNGIMYVGSRDGNVYALNTGGLAIRVFRSGQWILEYGMDGTVNRRFNHGLATDIRVVG